MNFPKACARHAIVALLILGLAGCASDLTPRGNPASAGDLPMAVFTGEFVDGLPLYRLPRMEVIGSRKNVGPDT